MWDVKRSTRDTPINMTRIARAAGVGKEPVYN
jgi:hypothetical protein